MDIEIYDNFLKEPEAIRAYAKSLHYQLFPGMGTTLADAPYWQDYQFKFGMPPRTSFFRMGDGKPSDTYVHSDKSVAVKTAILYLNKPGDDPLFEQDGTSFWMHKLTGEVMPLDTRKYDFTQPEYRDATKWELIERVDMKFNRLIYYDARYYHSRTSEVHWNGRLIQTVFF